MRGSSLTRLAAVVALVLGVAALGFHATPTLVSAQAGALNISFGASPPTAQVGQTILFNYSVTPPAVAPPFPTITSLVITFDDGTTSGNLATGSSSGTISDSFPKAFATAGTHTATLTATASNGETGSASTTVTVVAVQPPTVTLAASPASVTAGQPVRFVGTVTLTTPGASIASGTISFGDSTGAQGLGPIIGNSFAVTHTYQAAGTYTATVTVTDTTGQSSTASTVVTVTQQCTPPTVSVSASPQQATAGQPVTISYTATAGSGCTQTTAPLPTLSISFGDGTNQALTNTSGTVTHTYTAPGTYTVTVSVSSGGQTGQGSATVTVTQALPQGMTVTLPAGWNLIGGSTGAVVTGAIGPLYSFQPGDTQYEIIPNGTTLQGGLGYWAYLPSGGTLTLPTTGPQTVTKQAPAGQFFMVGNAGNTAATVSGAEVVYVFSPTANNYVATTTLQPGQGAWVYSATGGTVTVTNTP